MMNINRLLHAYVTNGGHWHEGVRHPDGRISLYRCSCMKHHSIDPIWKLNPDYSTPVDFKRLLDKLFGDERMWDEFCFWTSLRNYCIQHSAFVKWLFSDYQRFCALFAEFLALPETVEEFGYRDCECTEVGEGYVITNIACPICKGETRILKPWAKIVKEDGDE